VVQCKLTYTEALHIQIFFTVTLAVNEVTPHYQLRISGVYTFAYVSVPQVMKLQHKSVICSPFSIWFIVSNFYPVLTAFRQFFTWIALGEVDLHFSVILVAKANAVEGGTTSSVLWYHQHYQATHVTDGVTVTTLSTNLKHKTSAAREWLCQIMLN
jgi:hypothetical protein